MDDRTDRVNRLTKILSGELFKALGFNHQGLVSEVLTPLFKKPIRNFAEICIGFDQRVVTLGFQAASQWIMPNFVPGINVTVQQKIPDTGPLLIGSNHPGAYDALVIASNVPRDDLKIVVNIPLDFITEIPATLSHFLYAPHDPYIRMKVVRAAINHLKSGGALLIFASGRIDPDPITMGGAEKEFWRWSRSLEIMLRRVPETNLLITLVSNILHQRYVNHIFTRFQKERPDKQRISEFLQVMNQIRSPNKSKLIPNLSVSKPYTIDELVGTDRNADIMRSIQEKAKQLLKVHLPTGLVR